MLFSHGPAKQAPLKTFGLGLLLAFALSLWAGHSVSADDPENGRRLYSYQGCIECHGPNAEGDIGPMTAGLTVSFEEFLTQLRTPREEMDAYPPELLNEADAADLYAFLRSLP